MTTVSRFGGTLFTNTVISLISREARALPLKIDMRNDLPVRYPLSS